MCHSLFMDPNQTSQTQQPINPTAPDINSSKSKVIPIVLGIAAAAVIAIGAYALGSKQSQPPFQSQKECESKTGKKCSLNMCQESLGSPQPAGWCKSGFYPYEDSSPTTIQPTSTESVETANWNIYEDSKFLNYSINYPQNWRREDNCALGNDCFASPDQKGVNEGVGGGYDIQKGILITVSLLGSEAIAMEYYDIACNQEGEIKGRGGSKCLSTFFNGINAIKFETEYGNKGYILTTFDIVTKKIRIRTLSLIDEKNQKVIDQILFTFKFIENNIPISTNLQDEGSDGFVLSSPNGGETLKMGATQTIKWNDSKELAEKTAIFLQDTKSTPYKIIPITSAISFSASSYSWIVPNDGSITSGNKYKILITASIKDSTKMGLTDETDGVFEISK